MLVIPRDVLKKKKKESKGGRINPSRKIEKQYQDNIFDYVNSLIKSTLFIINNKNKNEILHNIDSMTAEDTTEISKKVVGNFIQDTSELNKEKMQKILASSIGVNFLKITDGPNISSLLSAKTDENINLIRSISPKYYSLIKEAVVQNFDGSLDKPLVDRMQEIGNITKNRAKLIARDQTGKLNSALTTLRHQDAGINEYIWRTSEDERVVGNPGGLYPTGNSKHMDHFHRNGKRFNYSNPPPDGNPGEAIQCRCVASPVIDLDKVNATYV